MPGRDGTGPQGMGKGTGRGPGRCGNKSGQASGFGFGRGGGRRNRNRFGNDLILAEAQNPSVDNITELKAQADVVESYLNTIKSKINQLEEKQEN